MAKGTWPKVVWSAREKAWKVDARTKEGGERKFFKTEAEAKGYAQLMRAQRKGYGDVSFIAAARELAEHGKTVADAIAFYLRYLRAKAKSVSIDAGIEELVENKKKAGASVRYQKDLQNRLGKFRDSHPDLKLSEVTTSHMDAFLEGLKVAPGTRNSFRRDLQTLFSFAVKRGYCETNPAKATSRSRVSEKPVSILTIDEAAALLKACGPDLIPFVSIALFTGLRTAELEQLDWSEVYLSEMAPGGKMSKPVLEVRAAKAKTRSRRIVNIEPNLVLWLQPYVRESGKIVPFGLRTKWDKARQTAGWKGSRGDKGKDWPENVMRHSYGSYHLAMFKDVNRLALEMGNSPEVIFKHYREVVRESEAEKYWAITPSGVCKLLPAHKQLTITTAPSISPISPAFRRKIPNSRPTP